MSVQVYKGVLRSTGELVAVKVQRPGIGDHIAIDMLLLRRLMAVIDKNQTVVGVPHLCCVCVFAEILAHMFLQCIVHKSVASYGCCRQGLDCGELPASFPAVNGFCTWV